MKITTQTRYAMRFLMELAINEQNPTNSTSRLRTQDISTLQNISEKYLEAIASKLRKGGFINSIKGINGGYWLAKDPSIITLGDVIRVMENEYFTVHCIDEPHSNCPNFPNCTLEKLWSSIEDKINVIVDSVTLESLIQLHN